MTTIHHPRKTWEDPRLPVVGPKMVWSTIQGVAIHYTAAVDLIDGDLGEFVSALPAYMRAIQRDYNNRKPVGYSIGYNFAVDWLGGIWECRGFDIKCAAHAPLNEEYNAILMLVDNSDRCTDEAAESVRSLIAEMEVHAGRRELSIFGHGKLPGGKPTACPGSGLLAQIAAGVFSPRFEPKPPPVVTPPTVPQEPADMTIAHYTLTDAGAQFYGYVVPGKAPGLWIALQVEWLDGNDPNQVAAWASITQNVAVKEISVASTAFKGTTLIGPLPPDGVDAGKQWRAEDFKRVVS